MGTPCVLDAPCVADSERSAVSGVHQFVPMLHVGDAVGQHTLALQVLLRGAGVVSEIYVERGRPRDRRRSPAWLAATPTLRRRATCSSTSSPPNRCSSPGSSPRAEPLVLNYHNVTPAELFAPWDNALARAQLRAQNQLPLLAGRALLGVAVSEFNHADLVASGFGATVAIPPVLAGRPWASSAPQPERAAAPDQGCRWLVVGRLAPNKAVEDVINALFVYRRIYDAWATLTVVGKPAVAPYAAALADQVAALGLLDAVIFAGRVGDARLAEEYRRADVLVVTSEHEGFCLPVVEAMAHDLPVVAYRRGALPEVLGDAGVLVERKDPATVAGAVSRVCSERQLRRELVAKGRLRLPALGLATAGERLVSLLVAVRERGVRAVADLVAQGPPTA